MAGTIDLYSLKGRVRKINVPTLTENTEDVPAINDRGELLISPASLAKTELTRLGNKWSVKIATGSAFTAVAGYPSSTGTRAELVLYNGEPVGGKSYVLDSAWALGITSMAAAGSIALVGQYVLAPTAPANDTAQLVTSRMGKAYGGNAKVAVAQTSAITEKWELLANSINGGSGTAQKGLAAFAELFGAWVIRPGDMFALNMVAGTAAGTFIAGITWDEVQLP